MLDLLEALTRELSESGYTPEQSFGYSADQLEQAQVHLIDAVVQGHLVGLGGVELDEGIGELKRFYVAPTHRGTGVADALLDALIEHAASQGAELLRLETGDRQHAAIAFYRRHGFCDIPRYGPYVESATSVCMQRSVHPR